VARQEPARAIKRLNGRDLDLVLDLDLYLESREKSVAKVAPLRLVATIVAVDEVAEIAAEDVRADAADADADAAYAGVWSEDTPSMLRSAEVDRRELRRTEDWKWFWRSLDRRSWERRASAIQRLRVTN